MVKKILILFLLLLNFNLVLAKNCGENIECECGDIVTSDYVLKENLICDGDGLKINEWSILDCNGYQVLGVGNGNGISINGRSNLQIQNCFISNFTNGIYFSKDKLGTNYFYFPENVKIQNNIFKNNEVGIFYSNSFKNNQIFQNKFIDNKKAGIKISERNGGYIWDNFFYGSGIYYKNQPYVKFCKNELENKYFDGAIGPLCDCIAPYDDLRIYGDVNFCSGQYYLPNGIKLYTELNIYFSDININCFNTNLIGNGSNSGITIAGSWKNTISNCNISNYENGILLTSSKYRIGNSIQNRYAHSTNIINNTIFNVKKGIKVNPSSSIENNIGNIIIFKNESLIGDNISKKIYLDLNLQPSILNKRIKSYLINSIGKDFIVQKKSDASIIISVGNFKKKYLFDKFFPILDKNPYSGKLISNKTNINIVAKGTVGNILLVKELIKNFDKYVNVENEYLINDSNIEAIGVYDYLVNQDNKKYYNKDLKKFGLLIDNILNDKMFNLEKKFIPIELNNTQIDYQIWHLSSNKSDLLKLYVDEDKFPIVMAGGLWSDIKTWNKLGINLANEGFEVYLLELTGGNGSECDKCYNYFYENLTNVVYPEYINYILKDSNSEKIKYVGHSNGARVAVDSLSNKKINSSIIDTLVLVGIPGAFEDEGLIAKSIGFRGKNLKINKSHLSMFDLLFDGYFNFNSSNKISFNLWKKYLNWINCNTDVQPGINLNISKNLVIGSYLNKLIDNDGIVTLKDEVNIYSNIRADKKYLFFIQGIHVGMSEDNIINNLITKFIKNKEFNQIEKLFYLEDFENE